jgi:hypothetical protein
MKIAAHSTATKAASGSPLGASHAALREIVCGIFIKDESMTFHSPPKYIDIVERGLLWVRRDQRKLQCASCSPQSARRGMIRLHLTSTAFSHAVGRNRISRFFSGELCSGKCAHRHRHRFQSSSCGLACKCKCLLVTGVAPASRRRHSINFVRTPSVGGVLINDSVFL